MTSPRRTLCIYRERGKRQGGGERERETERKGVYVSKHEFLLIMILENVQRDQK